MRNFIVLFKGKEGTSPLMRLLDRFENVDVIHQVGNRGWEPFDFHNCGAMSLANLEACLDHVYGKGPIAMDALNAIYQRTATRALHPFHRERAVGFKMRFQPPFRGPGTRHEPNASQQLAGSGGDHARFPKLMIEVLKRHDVTVFLAVRQDLLRWALSLYHGAGTGKPGHRQFKLARGEIRRKDLQTILELGWTKAEIERACAAGAYFEKVHSHDLASWILNYDEVRARVGNAYEAWY